MTSRPPNNTGGRAPRGAPRPIPRGHLVPVRNPTNDNPNPPVRDLSHPTLEEIVREKRRTAKRAAIQLTVRIVLAEIWLTSVIGSLIALHAQWPGHAITPVTHPWMWWTIPETFPVLAGGTVMIIGSLWTQFLGTVLTLRGPEYNAAAISRYFLGDE